MFQKHGHLPHMHQHISCKMRELARFVSDVRTTDASLAWLADCMCLQKFEVVLKTVRALCGYSDDSKKYKNPSLALKLDHSIKKCCTIAICNSVKMGDSEKRTLLEDFMFLCDKEWSIEVSSAALSTLTVEKMNKPQMIPLTQDIQKLNRFLQDEAAKYSKQLQAGARSEYWQALTKVTLVGTVLFNRKRGGEAERLLMADYMKKNKNPLENEDIISQVNEHESDDSDEILEPVSTGVTSRKSTRSSSSSSATSTRKREKKDEHDSHWQ
jgi:hypothetical protein